MSLGDLAGVFHRPLYSQCLPPWPLAAPRCCPGFALVPPTRCSECRISDWGLVTQHIALSLAAEPAAQVEMAGLSGRREGRAGIWVSLGQRVKLIALSTIYPPSPHGALSTGLDTGHSSFGNGSS